MRRMILLLSAVLSIALSLYIYNTDVGRAPRHPNTHRWDSYGDDNHNNTLEKQAYSAASSAYKQSLLTKNVCASAFLITGIVLIGISIPKKKEQ